MTKKFLALVFALSFLACASSTHKRSLGTIVDDSITAMGLKTKFIKDDSVPARDISVKVRHGVVTLTGELDNQNAVNRAIEVAEMQKGVKEVKAYLVLREFGNLRQKPVGKPLFKTLFQNKRSKGSLSPKEGLNEKDLDEETVRGDE